MSTASKTLRRQLEVAALFGEAQEQGREWLEGVRTFRAGPTKGPRPRARKATELPYAARRLRAERIVEAVRSGRTRREVARAFGVSYQLVCKYAHLAALPPAPWRKRGPARGAEAKRARLLEALNSGASRAEAARKADMSIHQARKLALRAGLRLALSTRERARLVERRDRAIADAVIGGERTSAVARRHGLSYHRVFFILRRAGVRLGRVGRAGRVASIAPPAFVPEHLRKRAA